MHLQKFMQEVVDSKYKDIELNHDTDNTKDQFQKTKDHILDTFIGQITTRCKSLEGEVLKAEAILTFEKFLEDKGSSLEDIQLEWPQLKVFVSRLPRVQLSALWQDIFNDDKLRQRFSNFLHLVELILVLPMATASLERGFSAMKRRKSDWRSISIECVHAVPASVHLPWGSTSNGLWATWSCKDVVAQKPEENTCKSVRNSNLPTVLLIDRTMNLRWFSALHSFIPTLNCDDFSVLIYWTLALVILGHCNDFIGHWTLDLWWFYHCLYICNDKPV